jgi:hypothetical protein
MRFIKTPAQAAAVVDVLREVATAPPPARKGKKRGGPVKLANPKLVSAGPGDFVTIDFRHHAQCNCAACVQKNSQPKRRKRNGSR